MFKNYLITAVRNLRKNKAHSFINIAGLSVGMAVAMLIGLWINDELSFNKYHKNYNRIAQVMQSRTFNAVVRTGSSMPMPLGAELIKNYGSDFKYVVMSSWNDDHILAVGDKKLLKSGSYMDVNAPEMLTLNMLKGTRNGLANPSSIMLSQRVAKALFGDEDPMGKIIKIDNSLNVKVTGIYEDLPVNTQLKNVSFIAPWSLYATSEEWLRKSANNWGNNAFQVYVQLADNADMATVSNKIKDAKLKNQIGDDRKANAQLFLQPMAKWHLYADFKNGVNIGGRIQYVWMFGIIGMFILLLACINFMNLSTARSEKRAKEVGVRKAVGSLRGQLIYQFYIESVVVAIVAFVFAIGLVQALLPFFNKVADKQINILWANPLFWLTGVGFSVITGIIAGSYPALYLSSFNAVKVLKGSFKAGRYAAMPRKVLVVVQFAVSVILIISTVVVFRQIQFAKNRPVGYNRDGLVTLPQTTNDLHKNIDAVYNDMLKSGAVTAMAESSSPATEIQSNTGGLEWPGKDPSVADDFSSIGVSYDYGKTLGWQFLAGRDFSKQFATDSSALVINEAAAKYMGLKNPVGTTIKWDNTNYKIIGVVKNVVMGSPYQPVKQAIYYVDSDPGAFVTVRVNPGMSMKDALVKIEAVYKKYSPAAPFNYEFVDNAFAEKFEGEERVGKLASFFAALAIFISCLGLFGMATFMAEQRTKEIGVRKVLGASVFNLWGMLSKDFIVLVVISLLIATPLAYYFMSNWLMHYEYRANMPWWVFAAAGAGALVITLITVSYQSIKAALMNPVKSLKTE
jgi:putative ABC transport system permease protein